MKYYIHKNEIAYGMDTPGGLYASEIRTIYDDLVYFEYASLSTIGDFTEVTKEELDFFIENKDIFLTKLNN